MDKPILLKPLGTSLDSARLQPSRQRLLNWLLCPAKAQISGSAMGSGSEESEGAAEEPGGLFLPDFLAEAPDGDWGTACKASPGHTGRGAVPEVLFCVPEPQPFNEGLPYRWQKMDQGP